MRGDVAQPGSLGGPVELGAERVLRRPPAVRRPTRLNMIELAAEHERQQVRRQPQILDPLNGPARGPGGDSDAVRSATSAGERLAFEQAARSARSARLIVRVSVDLPVMRFEESRIPPTRLVMCDTKGCEINKSCLTEPISNSYSTDKSP